MTEKEMKCSLETLQLVEFIFKNNLAGNSVTEIARKYGKSISEVSRMLNEAEKFCEYVKSKEVPSSWYTGKGEGGLVKRISLTDKGVRCAEEYEKTKDMYENTEKCGCEIPSKSILSKDATKAIKPIINRSSYGEDVHGTRKVCKVIPQKISRAPAKGTSFLQENYCTNDKFLENFRTRFKFDINRRFRKIPDLYDSNP